MFACHLCKKQLSVEPLIVIKHFRSFHGFVDGPHLHLQCDFINCGLPFKTFSGFRKHLNKHRGDVRKADEVLIKTCNTEQENESANCPEEGFYYTDNIENDPDTTFVNVDIHENIKEIFSLYASQIMSLNLSATCNQKILNYTSEFLHSVLDVTKFKALEDSTTLGDVKVQLLSELFSEFKSGFAKIDSSYKLKKLIRGKTVQPKEIALGNRIEKMFDSQSGTYVHRNVTSSFMYVPLLDTLRAVINEKFLEYFDRDLNIESQYIEDIHDGSIFKTNSLVKQHQNIIQIQLYCDEYETVNPLGSKTGVHKLGGVYFSLRNVPPHFNSRLDHIHLLSLFYTIDLKTFGFNKILGPIVDDIKELELQGIKIADRQLFGTLVALSHDNLGANMMHGMVQSFSATHYCRICIADKTTTHTMCVENTNLLRTSEQYESHCNAISESSSIVYGIKERSCLNDLQYFKLNNGMSVDIMHDILEGVGQRELKLFIKFLTDNKFITLENLNDRIYSYDYGVLDIKDKPSRLSPDKTGHYLGQRAAQTWVLLRFFPLIISDLLQNNIVLEKWSVLSKLLQIMSIIFAPKLIANVDIQLTALIEEHHTLFLRVFDGHLTPKHHMMIHYPRCIKLMGPLVHLWSMRYEAKHAFFKSTLKLHNFKHITKSLTERHQYMTLYNYQNLYQVESEYGPSTAVDIRIYSFKQVLMDYFDVDVTEKCQSLKWLKYGFLYKRDFIILLRVEPTTLLPIFGQIVDILVYENQYFFITKVYATKNFKTVMNSYIIETELSSNKFEAISFCNLVYKEPFQLHQSYSDRDSNKYIVLKYNFVV